MRIAFLTVSAEMGGSERCLVELVRGLRRLHPDWALDVVLPRDGPLAAHLQGAGAATVVLPMPSAISRLGEKGRGGLAARRAALLAVPTAARYVRDLRILLRDRGTDIIHSNGFKLHVLGARAAGRRIPLVWHIHEYVTPRRLSASLLRATAGRVAIAVANSRSVARDLAMAVGPRLRIETIHNGIDLDEYAPLGSDPSHAAHDARRDVADLDTLAGWPPAPAGTIRIGLVATFARWKGHDVFVRAIAQLDPALPIRAYVVGDAVYDTVGSQFSLEDLRRMAADAGVASRVGFTGFVEHTAPVLRALDIVVHASTQPEPFGLAIAEAMACGRAVVVSGAGGAAEIVADGCDALTHDPGDAAGLAAALTRLAGDASLRQRLGAAARAAALKRFDARVFAASFSSVYQSAASSRTARI